MTHWISAKKHLPEDFIDVLVLFPSGDSRYDIANYDSEEKWWSLPNKGFSQPDAEPTHWMTLPSYPKVRS